MVKTIQITENAIPIVIVNRDRLTDLRELVDWCLNKNKFPSDIIIIDNGSSYRPLAEYYIQLKKNFKNVKIISNPFNGGSRIIEQMSFVGGLPYYIYTESDVIPDENCPSDLINKLIELSNKHPSVHKVGLSLRTDDLPQSFPFRDTVIFEESKNRQFKTTEGDAYLANIHSSFALYRKNFSSFKVITKNIRTLEPLCARHKFWYYDKNNLPDDVSYYINKCSNESIIGKRFFNLIRTGQIDNINSKRQAQTTPSLLKQVDYSDVKNTNTDIKYDEDIVGRTYRYQIKNEQPFDIIFGQDTIVTGDGGKIGNYYMSDSRIVIEWKNCLNYTVDILELSRNYASFTGTSLDGYEITGNLKKRHDRKEIKNVYPEKRQHVIKEDKISIIEEKPKPVSKVFTSPVPQRTISSSNRISILVWACNTPTYRKLDFIEWNKDLFTSEKDVRVHLISDMPIKTESYSWLDVVKFKYKTDKNNYQESVNFALSDLNLSLIVVKADVDTIFTKQVIDNIRVSVSNGNSVVYHYHNIDDSDMTCCTQNEWELRDRCKTDRICIAMYRKDWYLFRGYDDKIIDRCCDRDEEFLIKIKNKIHVKETNMFPLYRVSCDKRNTKNRVLAV
jgi:hypothetical protein